MNMMEALDDFGARLGRALSIDPATLVVGVDVQQFYNDHARHVSVWVDLDDGNTLTPSFDPPESMHWNEATRHYFGRVFLARAVGHLHPDVAALYRLENAAPC